MQISQEAVKVVWYSNLFKNFPQFAVIHTVKGFGVVNKSEVDFFWNFLENKVFKEVIKYSEAIWVGPNPS